MDKEILYQIDNIKVFKNGDYRVSDGDFGISGSVFENTRIISSQFNQLKAKLFNLIEASYSDKEQKEAMKGMIKGFCNEAFMNTKIDIRGLFERLGFVGGKEPIGILDN